MTKARSEATSNIIRRFAPRGSILCSVSLTIIPSIISILAVQSLGEGVGYSLCQAALLISGLWGLFYFNEITGVKQTSLWLTSAVVTVVGMVVLSSEHVQDE